MLESISASWENVWEVHSQANPPMTKIKINAGGRESKTWQNSPKTWLSTLPKALESVPQTHLHVSESSSPPSTSCCSGFGEVTVTSVRNSGVNIMLMTLYGLKGNRKRKIIYAGLSVDNHPVKWATFPLAHSASQTLTPAVSKTGYCLAADNGFQDKKDGILIHLLCYLIYCTNFFHFILLFISSLPPFHLCIYTHFLISQLNSST